MKLDKDTESLLIEQELNAQSLAMGYSDDLDRFI